MPKFPLILVMMSVTLTVYVGAMKGGQILEKPLPYTVYIYTGDRDDLFFREKEQKYKFQQGLKPGGNTSAYLSEYIIVEENPTASSATTVSTTPADAASTGKAEKGDVDKVMSNETKKDDIPHSSNNENVDKSAQDKVVDRDQADDAKYDYKKELSSGTNTEKSGEESFDLVDDDKSGKLIVEGANSFKMNTIDENVQPSYISSKADKNIDGPAKERKLSDSEANTFHTGEGSAAYGKNSVGSDSSPVVPAGKTLAHEGEELASNKSVFNSETPTRNSEIPSDEQSVSGRDSTCKEQNEELVTKKSQWSYGLYDRSGNDTKAPPMCKLAAAATTASPTTTRPKAPPPQTIWRFCIGVILDEETIVTGDICFIRTEGLHFFGPVNSKNPDEVQEITDIVTGRSHFDFRVIRLNKNHTLPGIVPDWQDEDTVLFSLAEMSSKSRTGIVPSFGYPPKIAALKLLPLHMCSKIYDELLEAYPAQTSPLPTFLVDTVVCATQADKPVDFPDDGIGIVQPGLACPDSLGAPFVLDDGTVLGVMVAADCKLKNVAFFQTLGKGIPDVDEEDEDDIEHTGSDGPTPTSSGRPHQPSST